MTKIHKVVPSQIKASYDKDPQSATKSTARSNASYDKDPQSAMKSTARL